MSWHFLQEQEEASWEASSLDGAPFALLSLMPTAAGCCLPDSGTDSCRDSQSGTMCRPSTGSRGGGGWMLSVEDSHAPTYHKQSKTREASTATKADCGEKWRESLAKFDPDSFSWRTRQCLLFEDLGECLEIWPEWGSAHGTEFWERATLALPTTEGASGSWVTPNARDWKDSINMETKRKDGRCKIDQTSRQAFQFWKARGEGQSLPRAKTGRCATYSPDFAEWLMGWPIGWTDLKPLATDKFQQWLRSHGVCLEGRNDL